MKLFSRKERASQGPVLAPKEKQLVDLIVNQSAHSFSLYGGKGAERYNKVTKSGEYKSYQRELDFIRNNREAIQNGLKSRVVFLGVGNGDKVVEILKDYPKLNSIKIDIVDKSRKTVDKAIANIKKQLGDVEIEPVEKNFSEVGDIYKNVTDKSIIITGSSLGNLTDEENIEALKSYFKTPLGKTDNFGFTYFTECKTPEEQERERLDYETEAGKAFILEGLIEEHFEPLQDQLQGGILIEQIRDNIQMHSDFDQKANEVIVSFTSAINFSFKLSDGQLVTIHAGRRYPVHRSIRYPKKRMDKIMKKSKMKTTTLIDEGKGLAWRRASNTPRRTSKLRNIAGTAGVALLSLFAVKAEQARQEAKHIEEETKKINYLYQSNLDDLVVYKTSRMGGLVKANEGKVKEERLRGQVKKMKEMIKNRYDIGSIDPFAIEEKLIEFLKNNEIQRQITEKNLSTFILAGLVDDFVKSKLNLESHGVSELPNEMFVPYEEEFENMIHWDMQGGHLRKEIDYDYDKMEILPQIFHHINPWDTEAAWSGSSFKLARVKDKRSGKYYIIAQHPHLDFPKNLQDDDHVVKLSSLVATSYFLSRMPELQAFVKLYKTNFSPGLGEHFERARDLSGNTRQSVLLKKFIDHNLRKLQKQEDYMKSKFGGAKRQWSEKKLMTEIFASPLVGDSQNIFTTAEMFNHYFQGYTEEELLGTPLGKESEARKNSLGVVPNSEYARLKIDPMNNTEENIQWVQDLGEFVIYDDENGEGGGKYAVGIAKVKSNKGGNYKHVVVARMSSAPAQLYTGAKEYSVKEGLKVVEVFENIKKVIKTAEQIGAGEWYF